MNFLLLLACVVSRRSLFFFFNDTATTEIYTLSLHDALPIFGSEAIDAANLQMPQVFFISPKDPRMLRSEEHTSELQSRLHLVCRLLLEKKKQHFVCRLNGATNPSDTISARYTHSTFEQALCV